MADKIKQDIEGNNNLQQQIIVQGDNNNYIGLKTEDVISIIKAFCYTDEEQIVSIVKETIESINEEQRRMPDKRIFVPIIQQLSYSMDDEYIKNLYKNLLKASMDKNKNVHPSFVMIINQLNADEIKLLNTIPPVTGISKPLIDVRMIIGNQPGLGYQHISNFSDISYGVCENPGMICSYIENLERLKLIEIPTGVKISDDSVYEKLKSHPAIINELNKNKSSDKINISYEFDKKLFRLTQFGYQFLMCCK